VVVALPAVSADSVDETAEAGTAGDDETDDATDDETAGDRNAACA